MAYWPEIKAMPIDQPLKRAALRRNLGTSAIIAMAFCGAPFGLPWLATSSTITFVALLSWRLKQQQTPEQSESLATGKKIFL
jgi:hypothetical protein